jgi:serine/threonine protein kinase
MDDPSGISPAGLAATSPLVVDIPPELANHPRYRIVGMLGKGGMGIVYKAEHRVMKRDVALKVIATNLVAEPAALARFRREVEAAAKLSHPNIVTAHDAEQAGNFHFLVMELVDGISFDLVLKRKGPLPAVYACDYMRQAALGLQHAHEHGMVHRDIKLQNLMLTRKGQVKILDFGLARFASECGTVTPLTEHGALTGTPDFISPEQAEDARSADVRSDIYSLGCTFYTLLTGKLPFPGNTYIEKLVGHLKKEPAPVTRFRRDLPSELVRIVERMMAKDPARRYQTPDEVARALAALRKAGAPIARPSRTVDKHEDSISQAVTLPEATSDTPDLAVPKGAIAVPPSTPLSENIQSSEETPFTCPTRARSFRRRTRTLSRRSWTLAVVGIVLGLVGILSLGGLLLVALIRGGSGDNRAGPPPQGSSAGKQDDEQGHVRVLSMDPFLKLTVRRGDKVFGTIGPHDNSELRLPPGEYEVEVVDGAPEMRGFKGKLSVARGDLKGVEVLWEGITVRDFPAGFPPPPGPPGGPPPHPPFGGPPPHPNKKK